MLVSLQACNRQADTGDQQQTRLPAKPTFVGSQSCAGCHQPETEEWHGSDHHLAMQEANAKTVLGDFDNVKFTHFDVVSTFYKQGERFFVKTPDSNGTPTEYPIDYTFGHQPLQQYLIKFPGGRYQALNICWDSRPKEEGGQRWFHLYPDEKIPSDDELHWTRQHFNWNYMCADCHSTNLKKNYDLASNTSQTTWSEMNVSCESCHGPGSNHVAWASKPDKDLSDMGLAVVLKEKPPGHWLQDPETNKPVRSHALDSHTQVENCARCHSHRRILEKDFQHGQRFADTHRPAILEQQLYHPDGQINEEVYVYGSFVQSKMYHEGVRCTDCHNPHTTKLRFEGNLLCAQCHQAGLYDTPSHHYHQPESSGAQCVECHMPSKHYMVVDPRRDHSLRVPRPDLSVKLGTPNACNQCHQDQSNEWAADALRKWLDDSGKPAPPEHYGEVIAAGRANEPGSEQRLIDLIANQQTPGIARATAVSLLGNRLSQAGAQASLAALSDADPAVREAALTALEPIDAEQRIDVAVPLLRDPIRAVRIEAARILASTIPLGLMSSGDQRAYNRAQGEYERSLRAVADRPGSHMGLGLLYSNLGDAKRAEESYRQAIAVDPTHAQSRVNLAELLFQRGGRQSEAQKLLQEAVSLQPDNGIYHEALGRHWIRVKDYQRGLASIGRAAQLMPDNAHVQFFYGVALNQLGQFTQALPFLQKAHQLEPDNAEYLSGLATICRDHRQWPLTLQYAQDLANRHPQQPGVTEFLQEIRAQIKPNRQP